MTKKTNRIATPKALFCLALILFIGVWAIVEVLFCPRVRINVETELVGPDHEAIALMTLGKPLDEIKKAVKDSVQNVDDISWSGESLLCYAVTDKRIDVAEWLLSEGANPNGIHPACTPLEMAIAREDIPMIRLLVKWGADPDLRFPDGWTSRSSLKLENNQEMMDALLSAEKTATEAGSLPNELGSDRD